MNAVKLLFRKFINLDAATFGPEHAKALQARLHYGKKLNLKNPKTFSEKVCWLEYNTDLTERARLSDKIEVREFVKNRGFEDTLIPIVAGPFRKIEDFNYNQLPDTFVMKPSHGASGDVLVCKNKSLYNEKYLKKRVQEWLESDYHASNLEPHYKLIPHGVYCERIIDYPERLVDYKFFCFDGKPWLILVCSNRKLSSSGSADYAIYDLNWNRIDCLLDYNGVPKLKRPGKLNEMISIASSLSKGFPVVRVDLYCVDSKVYFGEMTFTPNGGVSDEFNEEQEIVGGSLISIN